MRLNDLPPRDRPCDRLLSLGPEALSDRELLALLLRTGRQGQSAFQLADALIADFGGLSELSLARPEEVSRHPGVGPAKAATLAAAFRLGQLALEAPTNRACLRGPEDVARVGVRELHGARRERVIVLVCDPANRLVRTVPVGEGAIDRSLFPIREILNAVLRHDGRAFAVAHNHPSGDPTPSQQDADATRELAAAAKVVGLRFVEHVVVAGEEWQAVTTGQRTPG